MLFCSSPANAFACVVCFALVFMTSYYAVVLSFLAIYVSRRGMCTIFSTFVHENRARPVCTIFDMGKLLTSVVAGGGGSCASALSIVAVLRDEFPANRSGLAVVGSATSMIGKVADPSTRPPRSARSFKRAVVLGSANTPSSASSTSLTSLTELFERREAYLSMVSLGPNLAGLGSLLMQQGVNLDEPPDAHPTLTVWAKTEQNVIDTIGMTPTTSVAMQCSHDEPYGQPAACRALAVS